MRNLLILILILISCNLDKKVFIEDIDIRNRFIDTCKYKWVISKIVIEENKGTQVQIVKNTDYYVFDSIYGKVLDSKNSEIGQLENSNYGLLYDLKINDLHGKYLLVNRFSGRIYLRNQQYDNISHKVNKVIVITMIAKNYKNKQKEKASSFIKIIE